MHPEKFGDSYDIVKRFLLSTLAPLGPWQVHPMFTDPKSDRIADAFSNLLEVSLISKAILTAKTRAKALDDCRKAGHLLLDPDTGIWDTRTPCRKPLEHVYISELVDLAQARPESMTVVFDQSCQYGDSKALQQKLNDLHEAGLPAFAYVSQACFLFVGAKSTLIERAHSLLIKAGLPENRLLQSVASE